MPKLDSLEYKKVLLRFGKDVNEILGDTYQATKPNTAAKTRASAIKTARAKLDEYESLITHLDGSQRTEATKRFGDDMDLLRERLAELEKGAK